MTLKICMFVYNNCQHDSRVLKEASTLVQAGHQVRIVALLDADSLPYEERDGFTIIRIPKEPLHCRIIYKMNCFHLRQLICQFADSMVKTLCRPAKWCACLVQKSVRKLSGSKKHNVISRKSSKEKPAPKPLLYSLMDRCAGRPLGYILHNMSRLSRLAIRKSLMTFHRPLCFWDYYCRSFPVIKSEPADVYHAHDLNTLPLAYWLKKKTGGFLVYDSHEFYVERNRAHKPSRIRKYLLKKIEGFFVKSSDHVITVSDSIGVELQKRYSVKQLSIILNAPLRDTDSDAPGRSQYSLRNALNISEKDRIVLYVGNISLNRGLEYLIRSVGCLENCVLVMMGKVAEEYAGKLKQVAADSGVSDRVHFFGPVSQNQVIAYASSADIGAAPILNACLSYYYCLPNKLFECMNAGLPTIGSDFPELKKVIEGYEIGKTFDPEDPNDIAASIRYVLSDKQRYGLMRRNSLEASKIFNWGNESKKLLAIYDDLGGQAGHKKKDWVLTNGAV